jgi:hypothetical protein
MLKTKIEIKKWIKENFKNKIDFEEFLYFDWLENAIKNGSVLKQNYRDQYIALKSDWEELHNTIKDLPEILIVERFGNQTHETMRTPLNYMQYFYSQDEEKRIKVFKN